MFIYKKKGKNIKMKNKKGLDIAKWNKITDYKTVKNTGMGFAIVKIINAQNY